MNTKVTANNADMVNHLPAKGKQIENNLKTRQINNAMTLGRSAMIEGKERIPWQDNNLMETLKVHQENIPGSASFNDLLEAWLIGWDIENLIQK
jgi:hypothetical protein